VSFLPLASSGWVLKNDNGINKKIISLDIKASFEIENIFGLGEVNLYEPKDVKPNITITIEFDDHTIDIYECDNKTWILPNKEKNVFIGYQAFMIKLDGIKFYNNNLKVELTDGSKIIFKDIKKL
jgi:hypothetical protein